MAKYQCNCLDHEQDVTKVTAKIIDGKVVSDVKCPCGQYMNLAEPKTGFPSLGRMNKNGSSY
jgi:hypothetical protein